MTEVNAGPDRTAGLRDELVEGLVADGMITSRGAEDAFRVVPRHLFAPGVSLEQAYARDRVVTKRNRHGMTISSVSAPEIQAMMLEQAEIAPGMRMLEVGSGGYNAALLAELVGERGEVTSIDIDPDIVGGARRMLDAAGYERVHTAVADGEAGYAAHAPFDRILVTVGAWDIPLAWTEQLSASGRIVVPLRVRGLTRSVAFVREGEQLVSQSAQICGFVQMQGMGAHAERLLLLRGEEIGLRLDEDEPHIDPHLLEGALEGTRTQVWSSVTVANGEQFDTLQMWLATALKGFCLLSVDQKLDTGLVTPQNKMACPAIVDTGSVAYLAVRKLETGRFEFGAHGFGPDAAALAEALSTQVQAWDREHRDGPGPQITVYPAGTPRAQMPAGRVISKRHRRILISWPSGDRPPSDQGVLHDHDEQE